jgi:hypothetical protein
VRWVEELAFQPPADHYRSHAEPHPPRWRDLGEPQPRFRLVGRALVSADPQADLDRIDIAATALVAAPLDLGGDRPGTATPVRDRPGWLEVETRAPSRQLLVVSESFHPGFEARVDGAPAPVLAAYGDFLAVPVPAGTHRVELRFRPRSFLLGAQVTTAALLAALLLHAPLCRRREHG